MTLPSGPLKLSWGVLPVALFLALGIGAAVVVPSDYGGDPRPTPPDEGPHLGYIEYLAGHGRLPAFTSSDANYEAHQPPLYYVSCLPAYLLARAVFPGPTGGLSRAGIVVVRLWTVLLASLTVWLGWLLGRRLFGTDSLVALGPPLFLALWPGRLMVVSAITNDSLAEALCLLTFLLALAVLKEGYTPRRALILGSALSLALLTKSTSMALGPIVLLALVMRLGSREALERDALSGRRLLAALAIVGGCVAVLAGWWFVRNQVLYGDPLAAQAFERLFSKDRATPAFFLERGITGTGYYLLVLVNTALSFWGVYGQANVYNPEWYYLLGAAVWLVAGLGYVLRRAGRASSGTPDTPVGRGRQPDRSVRPTQAPDRSVGRTEAPGPGAWALSWVLLILVVAFFLRFNVAFYQAQARYLFAAGGPIAALVALGLARLTAPGRPPWVLAAALLVMLIMVVWSVAAFPLLVSAHYPPPFFGG